MVFQHFNLFPDHTALENVALSLRKVKGMSRAEANERARRRLAEVGLAERADHRPRDLSGGQQQRVAIARALASHPKLLLMDEPYASVDAQTRADLEDLLMRIQQQLGITVLVVTHDIDESVYLADRIIVLSSPPSVVTEVIDVDLPRPRDHVTTKADARFVDIRAHVTRILRTPAVAERVG
jgi:NitT/TauT family transport system ATP-binding protein